MKLLLDTHVAVWWLSGDQRLSAPARSAIEAATEAFVSVVSLWEIFVKQDRGRLDLPAGFIDALRDDFLDLPLTIDHVLEGRRLPPIHRDPFDRMLIAQAVVERLTFVTVDRVAREYPVPVLGA